MDVGAGDARTVAGDVRASAGHGPVAGAGTAATMTAERPSDSARGAELAAGVLSIVRGLHEMPQDSLDRAHCAAVATPSVGQ